MSGAPVPRASSGNAALACITGDPRPRISRDTRSRDPPGTAVALLAARGARADRRTMPPTPARSIRAQ